MNDLPNRKQLEASGDSHGFRINPKQFVGSLVAIVLVLFILSNRDEITVTFLFVEFTTSQWVVLAGTALLGAAVGALMLSRRQKRRARRG